MRALTRSRCPSICASSVDSYFCDWNHQSEAPATAIAETNRRIQREKLLLGALLPDSGFPRLGLSEELACSAVSGRTDSCISTTFVSMARAMFIYFLRVPGALFPRRPKRGRKKSSPL